MELESKKPVVKKNKFFDMFGGGDISKVLTSMKLFAPISFILNIILIVILSYHSEELARNKTYCGQYEKLERGIYWLNVLASMNAALSLAISILFYTKNKLSSKLTQTFATILLVFNLLELVYAVQIQINSNKDGCRTNAWLASLWIIPLILIAYIVFLFFQSSEMNVNGKKFFGLI